LTPGCENDDNWFSKGITDKNCEWVKKKADSRCKTKMKDENGVSVFVACPKACGVCDLACDENADAGTWFSKTSEKDCDWVAKKDERCTKTDTENFGTYPPWEIEVSAEIACPVACNTYPCGNNGCLTEHRLRAAVDAYLDDADAAEATYGGPIGEWDVSCVTDMLEMFKGYGAFNAAIDAWDVSSVTNMQYMFYYALAFNAAIDAWDVSSVTNMEVMFYRANAFNGAIDAWDVSSVTVMYYMFGETRAFNGAIGAWDVSSVTSMYGMFGMFYYADAFNGAIDAWDVSSVTDMYAMFYGADDFDQNLGWCVGTSVNIDLAFDGSACAATSCGVTQGGCDE